LATQRSTDYHRYCPGEEQSKISDAVCLGRRRINYHKCRGCQFNDDERNGPSYTSQIVTMKRPTAGPPASEDIMIEKVFKAYDVRATVPDPLNEQVAWRIGNATAQFLRSSLGGFDRADPEKQTLIVGRDMRTHSPALSRAFIEGAMATDTPVIDIGMVDTPQVYFAASQIPCCGGAQTTASHNPANYNGFKICGARGKPIGAETGLKEIEQIARAIAPHAVPGSRKAQTMDLSDSYRAFHRRFLLEPRPLKVVIDASNGMAGRWFPILFANVPNLTAIPLNFEHNGDFVHPPNPLVPANLEQLRVAVRAYEADFGACFDGDADRCIFVDESAQIVRCDLVTALLAGEFLRQSPGATIVYDLRSSRVVPEQVRKAGGKPRRERVGHVFMKRTMSENNAVFGGELSGHFYFRDYFYCDSAMMSFICIVNALTRSGKPLGELIRPLDIYAASGERNFENADKQGTFKRIEEKYADGEIDNLDGVTVQFDDWWFNVRASNTEPLLRLNMEAIDSDLLNRKVDELTPLLGEPVEH
jgi:phosphomannomutase